MKSLLLVSVVALAGFQGAPGAFGNAVNVTTTGIVRIDPWTCYNVPTVPPIAPQPMTIQKSCPVRVEFGDDVSNDVLVCRSSKIGQTCMPLGKLFPVK